MIYPFECAACKKLIEPPDRVYWIEDSLDQAATIHDAGLCGECKKLYQEQLRHGVESFRVFLQKQKKGKLT